MIAASGLFYPLIMETFGVWSLPIIETLKIIIPVLLQCPLQKVDYKPRKLLKRLSAYLRRYNV